MIILLISFKTFACDCECTGDCTFKSVSSGSAFVALIKVIEYSDYLDYEIDGYDKKMPLSMTVEIIEKYIGSESRKKIKIWGDNGVLCRPYIANFEIGNYYLIAPSKITETSDIGNENDYDFFSCYTDYLVVDFNKKIAFGEYTKRKKEVSLQEFEREIKNLTFKKTKWFANNDKRAFYKSDSITLYKILNKKNKEIILNINLILSEKNNGKDFTELTFKRNKKLILKDTDIENWTETEHLGKWNWKYDNAKLKLDLFFNKKINSSFKIYRIERDYLIWKKDNDKTTKVHFLVLKLKRMKQ